MAIRPTGGFSNSEALTGNIDFFTVHTIVDIEEGSMVAAASAVDNLVKLIATISTGAQPVIASVISETVDLSDAGNRTIYGLGSNFNQAGTTVNTIKFAIEHTETFFGAEDVADDETVAGSLAARLNGLVMPFGGVNVITTTGATKNTSVKGFSFL